MAWANPNTPNIPDYILFLQGGLLGISSVYLPDDSEWITFAFNQAVNLVLNVPTGLPGVTYTLAVYNCAAHIQIVITPDQIVNGVSYDFFKKQRLEYRLLQPVVGLVASSSDESTSVTNAVPDAMRQLTIQDLGFMRTPFGRNYLAYNQAYGPTVWGLS